MGTLGRATRAVLAGAALAALALATAPVAATNDPSWSLQWAPAKIGAPGAWEAATGAGVRIGIVDSGVDLNHEEFQGRVVANASCIGTNGAAAGCTVGGGQDVNGHGTHVAGIAAAAKDNGVGIAGIAPNAQLVVARVFQGDSANLNDVEAGIRWVVSQGAKIVNLSLGENLLLGGLLGGSASLAPVLNEVWALGAIPVVASGNAQLLSGPASYANVNAVVVGATGPDDEIASYSVGTGAARWALVAPGGNGAEPRQILSTYWRPGAANQYGSLQGTSMATPHVTGALALLLARGVGQAKAVELLLSTANHGVTCGNSCVGRLDLGAAIAATGPVTPITVGTVPPTTAAPATTPTTRRPRATTTVAPTSTTTVPPTTAPPETVPTTAVAVAPADARVVEVAARSEDEGDEVVVPGSVAAALLFGVAGGAAVLRRRPL